MTSANDRRARFLQEMGVGPVWALRDSRESAVPAPVIATEPVAQVLAEPIPGAAAWPVDHVSHAALAGTSTVPDAVEVAHMDWNQLRAAVAVCTKCRLCETRTQTVFGAGTQKARWLFVGEGPGYNEDLQGEPFIGAAGGLLDNMLAAMDLKRGVNAYIANIVKCRPIDANGRDRPPLPDEVAACLPYLERQIALIQPDIIVALGKTAAVSLLGLAPDTPISTLRGIVHRHADRPLIVTYHPAYLLRKPEEKGKTWRDLCLALTTYAGTSTPG